MPDAPEPCLPDMCPLAKNCEANNDTQDVAVSKSDTSTTPPLPVVCLCMSMVNIPITPHIPVPMSTIDAPTRTEGRPGSPVVLMMPPKACIKGS